MLNLTTLARTCLVVATALLSAPAASAICTGDCDGDDRVTVDELVRGVAIALGRVPADACGGFPAIAGAPTIDRLVLAVGNALRGCPAPCAVQDFAVDDAAEGGVPDFRSLSVHDAADAVVVDATFHPGAERIGPGEFIRLDGTPSELIVFGLDSFQVRSDGDGDGRFERVLYEGQFDGLLDDALQIRLPAVLLGDFHATRVSAFSITSDDRIPNEGALSLQCPTTPPSSPTPTVTPTPVPVDAWRGAFLENKQKWLSQGIESYRYRYGLMCYCDVPHDVRITVFDDEIAEVREVRTGQRVDKELYEYWYHTINDVFALIEQAIDYPAAYLEVEYHPQLGYPTTVFIDLDRRIFDEEIGIAASEVMMVVPPTETPTPLIRPLTATSTSTATATPIPILDNRDGTLLDMRNGLMWEKKVALDGLPNPDDPHDADNRYPWTGLCADLARCQPSSVNGDGCPPGGCSECTAEALPCAPSATAFSWLADLNARRFASYDDWRLPTNEELHSLFDPALFGPGSVAPPPRVQRGLHDPGCGGDCTDLTDPACSCTAAAPYWTRVPVERTVDLAWAVNFGEPITGSDGWPLIRHFHVRAVRGGSAAPD